MSARVESSRLGALAVFESPAALLDAVAALRAAGFERLEAWTPHDVDGLPEALGLERPAIPRIALIAGLTGAALAYLVQWWTTTVAYPLDVGGRPVHSAPAFVLITFEIGVLFAAAATFVATLLRSGLPDLTDPVFDIEGFESASIDRYWLGIDARDPHFDPDSVGARLREAGADRVIFPDSEP